MRRWRSHLSMEKIVEIRSKEKIRGKIWREKNKEHLSQYFQKPEVRFIVAKHSSKRRNITWNVSFDEFKKYLSKRCHYCDGILPINGSGLDRMDNLRGYVIGNVIQCCCSCNSIKGKYLTYEEMMVAMKAIKELRLSKVLQSVSV